MIAGWQFLAAIRDKGPDAQTEVYAYADWLEEQGRRQAQAGWIRGAACVRVKEQDNGKVKTLVLEIWDDATKVLKYLPKYRVIEVVEVRKVVSPNTLRRKLQNKRKKGNYWRNCPNCERGQMKKVLYEDFQTNIRGEWKLHWACETCKHRIELKWTGRHKQRKPKIDLLERIARDAVK